MPRKYIGHPGRTIEDTEYLYEEYSNRPENAPNVVYIVLDDMGFAALGCYGSTIHTPNIDRLAKEGLRYNNFHTTAICSATRCSLLTGVNHHKAGIASLVEWKTQAGNTAGHILPEYGTIAEILKEYDYSTFAVGKWHLSDTKFESGPYDNWPLGKGFERYYGFLTAACDQYNPPLVRDNSHIPQPKSAEEGYHCSEDLTDNAIDFIYNQKNSYPDKPFFLYLAYGATHSPHQAPKEYIDRYKGKFDKGWDAIRDEWFANQKKIGIIPEDAELTDRAPYVDAWDDLTDDRKKVFARQMEVYAGFLEHTDEQIGRLIEFLRDIEQLDNTVVVFISDNGASSEGGKDGHFNCMRGGYYLDTTNEVADTIGRLDELGLPGSMPHYPTGWANACNTPFQWYKMWSYEGGVKDPLIIRYPKLIKDPGAVRSQYHHVSDITPTILDIIGKPKPSVIKGVAQQPFTGTSFKYSMEDGNAADRKHVQYYEVAGNRGIYKDGWKANVNHTFNESYDDDVWELYHVETDYSEKYNVADQYPEKLLELREEFFLEAGRNNVFPMLLRGPHAIKDKWEHEGMMGSFKIPEKKISLKKIYKPFTLGGDVTFPADFTSYEIEVVTDYKKGDEGIIVSAGMDYGGFVFYVKNGKLHYAYNGNQFGYYLADSDSEIPEGEVTLRYTVSYNGYNDSDVEIYINGKAAGGTKIERFCHLGTGPVTLKASSGTPVVDEY
ncbi:MAG: arylsulfatase, partial [Lachnospiraceae bacterium]|nr:arylsulfatase [Lachnospiraceae bacterium]